MHDKENPTIQLEGAFFVWHSLAHVNRELAFHLSQLNTQICIASSDSENANVTDFPHGDAILKLQEVKTSSDIVVRHQFPPNFAPHSGALVVMQPWEFLEVPKLWVDFFQREPDQIWVNSNFTRNVFVGSGVPADKVTVLPLGFDPSFFYPNGSLITLDNWPEDEFRFLYVGGTIDRKGADLLINAYCTEFNPTENIRLVVKDTGTAHVYKFSNIKERIIELAADASVPQISYSDQDLDAAELAGLYRACHCLVQPYRAEGFCLPVIEAMACGLPVIVTSGGPTDDFVLQSCGWKIASQRVEIPQLLGLETNSRQGWLEPNFDDLRKCMREAFEERSFLTKEKGTQAATIAKTNWTWANVATQYENELKRLLLKLEKNATPLPKVGPKISLCMIVRNEERVLEDCLKSAKPHFDEIIVVDTGSTDRTIEIAQKYATRIVEIPWPDSFADARNESLKHAIGDWIFWLDADDTLPLHSAEMILQATASAPEDVAAFVVPVRFLDGVQVDHVKLIRNRPGIEFEGRIHEQILPSIRKLGGELARINAHVLHSGYDNSEAGQAKKRDRDFHLLKLDLDDAPNHPFRHFNMGMTYHYTGDHQSAAQWLSSAIELAQPGESHLRKAYALKAISLRQMNQVDECLACLREGIKNVGDDPELRFQLALTLSNLSQLEEAKKEYLAVLNCDISGIFTSMDTAIMGYKTFHNLAGVCATLGNYDEAVNWWKKAVETAPEHLPSAFELFSAAIQKGNAQSAVFALGFVFNREGPSENWSKMRETHADRFLDSDTATELLRIDAQKFPSDFGPGIVFARRLLKSGRVDEAVPLLRQLNGLDCAEAAFLLGVGATRSGDFQNALKWMERANELNPGHMETLEQIQNLKDSLLDGNTEL